MVAPRLHLLARLPIVIALIAGPVTQAAVLNVTTNDNHTKIEGATAGDEVVIAPGVYRFRVYLTKQGTVTNPITIRALDPANPPVWDFGNVLVEDSPGSYGAGDRGRGAWQFSGARHYRVSGLVIRNARTAGRHSAAIRYYNGSTNIHISDCLFEWNDNGLTGGTENSEATVEFCEFHANGNTNASLSSPTHNIYVYGGYLTLRYCHVHDPVQGQNFHIRCRESVLEYNWFSRANSYEGDLMSNDDFSGPGPFTQTMTLRGNVIVQKANPLNNSQIVAVYNDGQLPDLTLNVRALYNTFIGNGGNAAFVHLSNDDGTAMTAEISNNIIFGTRRPFLNDNTGAGTVAGRNNWLHTNATVGPLLGSIQTESPGFLNAAESDYRLAAGSACIGTADTSVFGLPGREYFLNETINRQWRIRPSARDVGAFESTTDGNAIGPDDPEPRPAVSISTTNDSVKLAWPLFAQDYQLQFAADLISGWGPVAVGLTTNDSSISVEVVNAGAGFYRLQQRH